MNYYNDSEELIEEEVIVYDFSEILKVLPFKG